MIAWYVFCKNWFAVSPAARHSERRCEGGNEHVNVAPISHVVRNQHLGLAF